MTDHLERLLRTTPWGTARLGDGPPWAYICPRCQSYVPVAFTNQHEMADTPKDIHIKWHVEVGN